MMSVEQVMGAIRKGDTIAARQDVVVAAYDRLWREEQERCVAFGEALWKLDQATEDALLSEGAADRLHRLDEVRGGIWATYNPASRFLKEQERRTIEKYESEDEGTDDA